MYPTSSWTHVCTDDSAEEAVRNGSSGAHIKYPDGTNKSLSRLAGRLCSHFRAEGHALLEATRLLNTTASELDNVVLLTDSMSTLQALRSDRDDGQTRAPKRELAMLTASSRTVLQWIPARVGTPGDERADQMAKAGRSQPQTSGTISSRETKTVAKPVQVGLDYAEQRLSTRPGCSTSA